MPRYNGVEIEDTFAETYSLNDTLHSVFGLNPSFFMYASFCLCFFPFMWMCKLLNHTYELSLETNEVCQRH